MDPLERFAGLLEQARAHPQIGEPTAMTLASVGEEGRPSVRVVLLKGVDARGLVFYTNLMSRKGREIRAHPQVSCVFWWKPLEVQIRFEGLAAQVPDAEADAYFASRPRGSQLGAWASEQSQPLSSRAELEARMAEVTARFAQGTIPRPPFWSGFRLTPRAVEFWRSKPDRLHERELYTREAEGQPWRLTLLYP